MKSLAIGLAMLIAAFAAAARAQTHDQRVWLKCSLTKDVVRDKNGKATIKPLTGSVIFVIDDVHGTFFVYRDGAKELTPLSADVRPHQVTFFDGPLSDTISRMTGTFDVVASPFHEAHGTCAPTDPVIGGKPKF